MADQSALERLQPSLLDRLTDKEPDNASDPPSARVIDIRQLEEIVRRDLVWLLNTNNRDTDIDAEQFPYAAKSVLNYGVGEISGEYSNRTRVDFIRRSIERAIQAYEPRISPASNQVIRREQTEASKAVVTFDIFGELWADPVPIELYLRSVIDLRSGELDLQVGA